MTEMKQKFQMRMRMPCSHCLCTRGGTIRPFEIITKRGELLRGRDHWGGGGFTPLVSSSVQGFCRLFWCLMQVPNGHVRQSYSRVFSTLSFLRILSVPKNSFRYPVGIPQICLGLCIPLSQGL